MGIRYGSKESIELCDMIGYAMADQAIQTSANIAAEKQVTYPQYNTSVLSSAFFSKNALGETKELVQNYGLYNSQLLTIAPTGSLSSMLGVSGGIEPIYANYYERKTESLHGHDEYYKVYTPIVRKYIEEHGLKDDSELPDYFVTAQTLEYTERINMQAIWQQHIDASISSTVNVPNSFSVEQVENLYMYAWEKGLKGVTIFRDGCKRGGILSTSLTNSNNDEDCNNAITKLKRGMIIKVDNNTIGKERHLTTGCGSLHCTAFFDPDTGELLETYLSKGSTGGCQSNLAAVSRLMSLSARAGVDVYTIVDQLKSCMTCPSYAVRTATKHDTSKGSSCPVAVGNALIEMYEELQKELNLDDSKSTEEIPKLEDKSKNLCPQCGCELQPTIGCMTCPSCGWTKCDL
jgi:ribonucleoside-diphosphate reductase alpha chain